MRKTRAAALSVLVLAAFGILSRSREHEPVYQGKTLTYWLSDFWPGRNPTPEKLEQDKFAVRQIGTNAIPILLQWISVKDDPFKAKMVTWISSHPRVPFRIESGVDKNMLAVSGFQILGKSQAAAAVPALVEIVKNGGGEGTSAYHNATFAMQALGTLDPEAAAKAGIRFGTNGSYFGWSAPPAVANQ